MGGDTAAAATEQELKEGAEGQQEQSGTTKDKNDAQNASGEAEGGSGSGGAGADESEGYNVVEEGATPASDRVMPVSAHIKAKDKWKQQKTALKGDAEAKTQEAELLKLQLAQKDEEIARLKAPKGPPKRADYESDESFDKAVAAHSRAQTEQLVTEVLRKHIPAAAASQPEPEDEKDLDSHYERAAKLQAPDFDAMEDEVMTAIGPKAARVIVKKFPNSEAVIYALGKNPARLAELVRDLRADPVGAIVNLTQYAAKLKLEPRKKAPPPDSSADLKGSGGGSGDAQKQLDALRKQRAAGKATTDDVLKFKKKCRDEGTKVV